MASKPLATVAFLGADPQQTQPTDVRVYQREFMQDVTVISLRSEDANQIKYRSGQPMSMWFGWDATDPEWFYGYVNHTEPSSVVGDVSTMNLYAAGAVWPMRLVSQRTFTGCTSDAIAATVAAEHRLSCLVGTDTYTIDTVAQAGDTDWQMLAKLAKRRGFSFYARNTDLRFIPRVIETSARVPLFTRYPNQTSRVRGAVLTFTQAKGETVPGQGVKATRVQHVVSDDGSVGTVTVNPPTTNLAGSVISDPVFQVVEQGHPAHSMAEAKANLEGIAASNRFHIGATAVLTGDTRVHQGMTIRIANVSGEDDGYWWVTEAMHHITASGYTTNVMLARDSVGAPVVALDVTTKRSALKGRPAVADATSRSGTRAVQAPPTVYDPTGTVPSVVPVGDPTAQVAYLAPRPAGSTTSTSTPAGVTKIDPARLHSWRASVASVRRTA